jgi:hypothetical protein
VLGVLAAVAGAAFLAFRSQQEPPPDEPMDGGDAAGGPPPPLDPDAITEVPTQQPPAGEPPAPEGGDRPA